MNGRSNSSSIERVLCGAFYSADSSRAKSASRARACQTCLSTRAANVCALRLSIAASRCSRCTTRFLRASDRSAQTCEQALEIFANTDIHRVPVLNRDVSSLSARAFHELIHRFTAPRGWYGDSINGDQPDDAKHQPPRRSQGLCALLCELCCLIEFACLWRTGRESQRDGAQAEQGAAVSPRGSESYRRLPLDG